MIRARDGWCSGPAPYGANRRLGSRLLSPVGGGLRALLLLRLQQNVTEVLHRDLALVLHVAEIDNHLHTTRLSESGAASAWPTRGTRLQLVISHVLAELLGHAPKVLQADRTCEQHDQRCAYVACGVRVHRRACLVVVEESERFDRLLTRVARLQAAMAVVRMAVAVGRGGVAPAS